MYLGAFFSMTYTPKLIQKQQTRTTTYYNSMTQATTQPQPPVTNYLLGKIHSE